MSTVSPVHAVTADAKAASRRRKASRHAAIAASVTYALLLAGQGVYMPFFPIWLAARGLNPGQIGTLLAIPMLMRALASAPLARIGDTGVGPRRTFVMMVCGAALGYLAFPAAPDFWTLAVLITVMAAFLAPTVPLLDVIVLDGVARHGHDYGRIRQWGSLFWLVASIGAGSLLTSLPISTVPPALATLAALTAFAGLALPNDRASGAGRTYRTEEGRVPPRLLFVVFLAGVACLQGAHSLLYSFGTIIWQKDGFSTADVGVLWAVGAVTEALFFLLAGNVAGRLGPNVMILLGGSVGVLRWVLMGLHPTGGVSIAILQGLHCFTFASVHLGTMAWLARFERGRAARQGVTAAVIGAALAIGAATAGWLYAALASHAFFVMAGVAALGVSLAALTWTMERRGRQPQSAGSGGNTTLPS